MEEYGLEEALSDIDMATMMIPLCVNEIDRDWNIRVAEYIRFLEASI